MNLGPGSGAGEQPAEFFPSGAKAMHIGVDLDLPLKLCQEVTLILGTRGCGKCARDTTVILLSNGLEVPIKDLNKYPSEKVVCLNNDLKLVPVDHMELTSRTVFKILKITTRSGRVIELTPEHPLLDINGWHPASEFKTGDMLATPRRTDFFGNEEMRDCEVKLVAYMLAEGGLTTASSVFTNTDPKIGIDFDVAVSEFHPTLSTNWVRKGICCLVVSSDYAKNVVGKKCIVSWCKEPSVARGRCSQHYDGYKHSPEFVPRPRHAFALFMEQMGIRGKLSIHKTIPDAIFKLPKRQLALFLNRLFSCDGTIKDDDNRVMEYYSSSYQLIMQVQSLLLRFGIIGRVKYKKSKCDGKDFDSWRLIVTSESEVTYLREIGFIGEKAVKAPKTLEHLLSVKRNPNLDVLPMAVWKMVKEECRSTGISTRELGRQFGVKPQPCKFPHVDGSHGIEYRCNPPGGYGQCRPSREKVEKMASILGSSVLLKLAQSDVFWDEVVSVEELTGEFTVCDIGVPDYHNFVAANFIIHNSYTLGVFLEEMQKNNISFALFDVLGAHREIVLPNVIVINLHRDEKVDVDRMIEKLLSSNKSYIINMMEIHEPAKQQAIVGEFSIKLLNSNPAGKGKIVVTVIEEAEEFAPAGTAKYIYDSIIPLNRLVKLGRARGCGVFFVTQRPQDMSARLRSQCSNFIVHRLTNYTELDVLRKQLVAASRGDANPTIQKVFAFKPGEALILSVYAPDGLAFTKIRQRETKHAGTNVLGDLGGSVAHDEIAQRPQSLLPSIGSFFGDKPAVPVGELSSSPTAPVADKKEADALVVSSGKSAKASDNSFDNLVKLAFVAILGFSGYVVYDSVIKKKLAGFDRSEESFMAYRDTAFKKSQEELAGGEKKQEMQPEDIEKLDDGSKLLLESRKGGSKKRTMMVPPPSDDEPNPFSYSPLGGER